MVGQDSDPVFHFGPEIMLRAPARPWADAGVEPEPDGDDDRKEPYSTRALADFLARAADPLLDEALAVSSPSLAGTVRAVRDGTPVKPAAVRRAALAVARYRLRASSRSPPFGLLAGVPLVRFGSRTAIRGDGEHRRVAGADLGWPTALFIRWERDPGVLVNLRVVANNLAVIRGDRVRLPAPRLSSTSSAARAAAFLRPRTPDRPATDPRTRQDGPSMTSTQTIAARAQARTDDPVVRLAGHARPISRDHGDIRRRAHGHLSAALRIGRARHRLPDRDPAGRR